MQWFSKSGELLKRDTAWACVFSPQRLTDSDTLQSLGTTAMTSSFVLQDGSPRTSCLTAYEVGFGPS